MRSFLFAFDNNISPHNIFIVTRPVCHKFIYIFAAYCRNAKSVSRLLFGVDSKIQANDLLQNNIDQFEWVVRNKIYPNFYGRYLTGENCLTKDEIKFLASSIIDYIPTHHYLLTCGESWKEKEDLFDILSGLLSDTGCLRTLKDREGGLHYYPILKKL